MIEKGRVGLAEKLEALDGVEVVSLDLGYFQKGGGFFERFPEGDLVKCWNDCLENMFERKVGFEFVVSSWEKTGRRSNIGFPLLKEVVILVGKKMPGGQVARMCEVVGLDEGVDLLSRKVVGSFKANVGVVKRERKMGWVEKMYLVLECED